MQVCKRQKVCKRKEVFKYPRILEYLHTIFLKLFKSLLKIDMMHLII